MHGAIIIPTYNEAVTLPDAPVVGDNNPDRALVGILPTPSFSMRLR